MDPLALADIAAFLGRDRADVLELRESADLLPALLARVGLMMTLQRPQSALQPPHQRVVLALIAVFDGEPFTSSEVIESTRLPVESRGDLRTALLEAGRGSALTPQRVGHLLRTIAESGSSVAGRRLEAAGTEDGSRLWRLAGTSGT